MANLASKIENYLPQIGLVLGAGLFLVIFGPEILNPTYIGWTMEGDAAQHFLGWHFFRSEPWSLPLGLIQGYQFPQGTSLVYTDSIPLLAVPLKLIAPILPAVFQYHGLWLLSVYLLQGYFAVLLLRQINGRPLIILIGTVFFLLSPVLVQRARLHESLTAHWIILAALYLYFQADTARYRLRWLLLFVVAALVHFYLLVMVGMIFGGFVLKQFLIGRSKLNLSLVKFSAAAVLITAVSMWLVGYFILDAPDTGSGGFGSYSMNLLAPLNPSLIEGDVGQVAFLEPMPLAEISQRFEGFNYFGLGLLALILAGALIGIGKRDGRPLKTHLPLVLVGLALFIIALSNKITVADTVLLDINFPDVIEKGLGIIRSTGRMFWPVSYMLLLAAIGVVIKHLGPKRAAVLLLICLTVQVVDLAPWYLNVNLDENSWQSPLVSAEWQDIMETAEHIVFLPPNEFDADIIPFAYLAASHGKTINVGVTARTDSQARADYRAALLQAFEAGILAPQTLYIIRDNAYLPTDPLNQNLAPTTLDGYMIIKPG